MSFFCRLSRKHYWCIPHRSENRLVQVCYECGSERQVPELHDELIAERVNRKVASARSDMAELSMARPGEQPTLREAAPEPIAVGERRQRRFVIVRS